MYGEVMSYRYVHTFVLFCFGFFCDFRTVPDDLVLQLLKSRLAQLDAVTKGWVIHGFPKTREQAESLARAGYEANR